MALPPITASALSGNRMQNTALGQPIPFNGRPAGPQAGFQSALSGMGLPANTRLQDLTPQQRQQMQQRFASTVSQAQSDAGIVPGSTRIADMTPGQIGNVQAALNRNMTGTEQFQTNAGDTPLIGLEGATQAINQGSQGAISALEELLGQARGEIGAGRERAMTGATDLFERGVAPLEDLQAGAVGAQQQQAALSGALGPEAQARAIAAFQESPQQAFLREQGERAITRNASALGGLGGGRVREELARFGTGLAAQDFANQFSRLGDVANRGLSAAGTAANLGQNQAALQTGIESEATGSIASLLAGQGRDTAGIIGGAGNRLADLRTQAGRDLANAISGTTVGVADLANQQGAALSQIFGEGAANVANLFNLAGQGDAAAQEQLAGILANINQDEAALLANLFAGQGSARLSGDIAGAESRRDSIESLIGAAGNIFS